MPEVTIKYKKPETLKILKELAKFLDFKIAPDNAKEQPILINGVTMLPAKDNIDPSDLTELFSSKNIDAAELRKESVAKEKVICDSDVIIDYWNINSKRHSDTRHILEDEIGLNNVALSAVTKMELVVGATNKHELARINKNIHQFNILLINDEITQLTIQLLQDYNLSHGLALPDALIAATAVITRFEIFTYNLKDYKFIEDIKLFDPQKHQAKNK